MTIDGAVDEYVARLSGWTSEYLKARVGASGTEGFALLELDSALSAFRRADMLRKDSDTVFDQLVYVRLIAEFTLRLAWITAEVQSSPESVSERADRLRRSDLIALRESSIAIHRATGTAAPDTEALDKLMATISGSAAPSGLRNLATTDDAEGIYAVHRMCSSLIHAGAAIRRLGLLPIDRPFAMAVETFTVGVTFGTVGIAAAAGAYPSGWPPDGYGEIMGIYRTLVGSGSLDA